MVQGEKCCCQRKRRKGRGCGGFNIQNNIFISANLQICKLCVRPPNFTPSSLSLHHVVDLLWLCSFPRKTNTWATDIGQAMCCDGPNHRPIRAISLAKDGYSVSVRPLFSLHHDRSYFVQAITSGNGVQSSFKVCPFFKLLTVIEP